MDLLADVADGLAQLDTAAAPPLPALTDEDVTAILTQLPSLSQLPACAAVCRQWARCVRSDGLLCRLCKPLWRHRGASRCAPGMPPVLVHALYAQATAVQRRGREWQRQDWPQTAGGRGRRLARPVRGTKWWRDERLRGTRSIDLTLTNPNPKS